MIPLAAIAFVRAWWKAGAGIVVGAALAFPLGQCSGSQAQKKHEEADRAITQAEALKVDTKAKEKAADQRVKDAAEVADMTEKLTDAVASLPDEIPSARRVALGCQRLRNGGADVSDLPIACRPPIGVQARPAG